MMNRTLLAAGASLAALSLSAPAIANEADGPELDVLVDEDAVQSGEASAAAIPMPTMTFGEWGVDPSQLDPEVDPGDDFFAYVNGKWIANNPIPAEYGRFGAFNVLREKSTSDVKTLVDELVASNPAPGSDADRVVKAYTAIEDTAAIEARGIDAIYPYVNRVNAAQTLEDLVDVMATPGIPGLVGGGVTVDAKDPESYIVSMGFSGMGLPDRDYYLVDNERNEGIRAAYKDYLALMAEAAGYADPRGTAEAVYGFERQVAEIEWDRTMMRNRDLTYNKLSRAELAALAPQFPTARLLQANGVADQQSFVASQIPPTADEVKELGLSAEDLGKIGGGLPAMMKLVASTPLPLLKAWMNTELVSNNAYVLPEKYDRASFELFGKLLGGQEEQQARWKRAIAGTEGQIGELLGKLYAEQYFPAESKVAMDELVANLRLAMAESIAENDWMTPETKAAAKAKLDAFTPKIGYPDAFETYDGLVITDDPIANRMAISKWARADSLAKLGGPVDRTEWFMLPQTVNAYYNSRFNEIVFPAAILQQPFFGPDADDAVNYGAIGGVIGHEIGHGFDDQGSKSDGAGVQRNWWQDADREKFDALGDMLVAQYDAYCPYDGGETCVNGRFTLGENIGDVGGLSLAYRAYRMSLGGKEAPVIDGLTGDQRFFLAWAQVWRSAQREAAGRQRLLTDSHSPETFRVNGVVRNIDAWYDAFGVTPDDDLYLPPEKRVRIW